MSEHVNQYLDAEALRLRSERAERLARTWRGTAMVLLVLLIAQTWLVVDTAVLLGVEHDSNSRLTGLNDRLNAERDELLGDLEGLRISWQTAKATADNEKAAAEKLRGRVGEWERTFRACKEANAGLVEGIREQQKLLNEAIEHAKRCRT